MVRTKKLTILQTKKQLERLDSHRFFFFSSTLGALDQVINHNAPVLLEKKGKDYGIKISTTRYPDKLNLVYRESGGVLLSLLGKPRKIIYGIEFSYGIPEIHPWFIVSRGKDLQNGRFALWREKPTLWQRITRKKFQHPRGINELLSVLHGNNRLQKEISSLLNATEQLRPTMIAFECFHKWGKIPRPNLAVLLEFKEENAKLGPEKRPSVWNEVVKASCSLLMVAREIFEGYRARHY